MVGVADEELRKRLPHRQLAARGVQMKDTLDRRCRGTGPKKAMSRDRAIAGIDYGTPDLIPLTCHPCRAHRRHGNHVPAFTRRPDSSAAGIGQIQATV